MTENTRVVIIDSLGGAVGALGVEEREFYERVVRRSNVRRLVINHSGGDDLSLVSPNDLFVMLNDDITPVAPRPTVDEEIIAAMKFPVGNRHERRKAKALARRRR